MRSVGFFIDEGLPPVFAAVLRTLGYKAVAATEVAPAGTDDVDHFAYCRENQLVFVTRDWEIKRRKTERTALASTGITVIEVRNPTANTLTLFEMLFGQLTKIVALLDNDEPEFYVTTAKDRIETYAKYQARQHRRKRHS